MASLLRIATFNLESLDDGPNVPVPLERRIEILRPQLTRLRADILCLQEVNGQRPPGGGPRQLLALDKVLETTPYAGFHRAATTRVGGADPRPGQARGADAVHNLVILSRYPLRAARELRHELVLPPQYRMTTAEPPARSAAPVEWDRPVLYAAIDIPGGRPLHVVNLHLRAALAAPIPGGKAETFTWRGVAPWAEGFFLATMKRAGQALEVRLLIDSVFDADPQALIAVAGDFNAEAGEMPLRTIRGDPADTGNPELAARTLLPVEQALPEARRFSVIHAGHQELLDHVLASPELFAHAQGIEVDNEGLEDELEEGSPRSHHAPLTASFDLSGNGPNWKSPKSRTL